MTSRARVYEFEGEQLTVAQIRQRVPALSADTIRNHLAAGRNTRQAMLAFDPAAALRLGGRRGRAASPMRGFRPAV